MSDSGEASLDKPRDRFHDMLNAINSATMGVALIRKEVEHTGQGISRIETAITAVQTQIVGVNDKVGRVETDANLKFSELKVEIAGVKNDIKSIDERYGTTKNIVYGMIGLIVTGVLLALIGLVILK